MRAGAIAALALWAGAALAQDPAPAARGAMAGTATRSVAQYTDLEQTLLEALRDHDRAAAQAKLAEDFELREPDGADAISGADWLDHWMGGTLSTFRIQDLAVREFGDFASVSFLQHSRGRIAGAALPAFTYVVDVWRQSDHKLLVRYVSTPVHHAAAARGADRRR
ncbi:MAG TPA: nuclear transport factor 2 family protein [Nevskia sp.]|jgi:hypothetical protein|nr:nuclear transport factor 2 family protein [Nevskia sp.]